MIDVKRATGLATEYFVNLYGQISPTSDQLEPVQLEEVELTEDGKYWLITLSYPNINSIIFGTKKREYKIFKLNAETGEFKSMKIREVA